MVQLKNITKILNNFIPTYNSSQKNTCKFVLLFQGRTGSTYITQRVNAHPDAIMEPEVWGGWGFQIQKEQILTHIQKQKDWLTSFYQSNSHDPIKSIGFKTKIDDILDKRFFIEYLRKQNIKIVHMSRRNTIKLVISEINAQRLFEASSTWNLEDSIKRLGPFTLDIEKFHQQLKWRIQIEDWLESYVNIINLPTLKLFYEDMLNNEEGFFRSLYDFVKVPYSKTEGKTLKNTPNDLRKIICNYNELLTYYKYTVYEPMILES